MELTIIDGLGTGRKENKRTESLGWKNNEYRETYGMCSAVPVYSMSWLAAWVITHFHMTLEELHCDVIIVSIIQQDTIVFSCGNLHIQQFYIGYLSERLN